MTTDTVDPLPLRQPNSRKILARCLNYLRPYWRYTAAAYLLLLINSGIMLVQPLIIRNIVDQGIRGGEINVIQLGALLLVVLTLIKGLFTFLSAAGPRSRRRTWPMTCATRSMKSCSRSRSAITTRRRRASCWPARWATWIASAFLPAARWCSLSQLSVLIVGIAISMLIMNVRLALMVLVLVPFLAYTALEFGRRFRPVFRPCGGRWTP